MYKTFGLEAPAGCELFSTLRAADSCMMYNANNLLKTSIGNIGFGAATYVLNPRTLNKRIMIEPWDGGLTSMMYKQLKCTDGKLPPLGTLDPPAFLHLLQPHEELFNMSLPSVFGGSGGGEYKSIAQLMNRWWVPGTPPPQNG
eukprot:SAG31_NODE_11406_length_1034_cov_1.519786_1_plen_142_part_10